MDNKQLIKDHIKLRLSSLEALGKLYSAEKIEKLATKLATLPKSIDEIKVLIDNKFSNEVRKINHNNHLATLKEYYLSSIEKLKKGNNCYLLSYDKGVKILEQAEVTPVKDINPFLKEVTINKTKKGYKKENSVNNDYELIMSDIAYLLEIPYAKTYRVFDEQMNPQGVINESFEMKDSRFLNMEEILQFIIEESPKFTIKSELIEYHDRHYNGLDRITDNQTYKTNLEYVFSLFKALPGITATNLAELRKQYINMKIFELLTNSLNNTLVNTGIIINTKEKKYTYQLSPSYNKYVTDLKTLKENETICNFFIVDKRNLLITILTNYYKESKDILTLIANNKETITVLINNILKEHLEYEEYTKYYKVVKENVEMLIEEINARKTQVPDTEEDKKIYKENDTAYNNRIAPFIDNYGTDELDADKGSVALVVIVAIVLLVTVLTIGAVLLAVSRMDM